MQTHMIIEIPKACPDGCIAMLDPRGKICFPTIKQCKEKGTEMKVNGYTKYEGKFPVHPDLVNGYRKQQAVLKAKKADAGEVSIEAVNAIDTNPPADNTSGEKPSTTDKVSNEKVTPPVK